MAQCARAWEWNQSEVARRGRCPGLRTGEEQGGGEEGGCGSFHGPTRGVAKAQPGKNPPRDSEVLGGWSGTSELAGNGNLGKTGFWF